MSRQLDVRGEICPYPMMKASEALKKLSGGESLQVLTDHAPALSTIPWEAAKHGYRAGTVPSDAFLEDLALHFSITVYHLASTCRMGSVVDPQLRVNGVSKLRVADASVMPDIVSGNTNAACIMIGEKAAEMVALDHHVQLAEFVGPAQKPMVAGLD